MGGTDRKMEQKNGRGRLLVAAAKSGSGKTTWTCGLLRLLLDAGAAVSTFKCGPDYIDPMFHRAVFDVHSGNLDSFFSEEDEIRAIVSEAPGELALIEGVMGIYDGAGVAASDAGGTNGIARAGSCYDVARITRTPILLLVDAKGMGATLLSIIKGLLADDTEHLIRAVAINRIGAVYFDRMRPALEELLANIGEARGVPVDLVGAMREDPSLAVESRHLGLLMPEEIADLRGRIGRAAEAIRTSCDVERIRAIMREAPELTGAYEGSDLQARAEDTIDRFAFRADTSGGLRGGLTLAVARDEAFCFYYEENLKLLREMGVRIEEFSPIRDEALPEADGLLLGGGYPELYAEELGKNARMRDLIRDAIAGGMPSLAECGGFLYLQKELETKEGQAFPMCGVIPGRAFYVGRSGRFGYITLRCERTAEETPSLLAGLAVRGHEYHYFDTDQNGADATATKPSGASWPCLHIGVDHIWGFPHLYYPSCPALISRFIDRMRAYQGRR